MASKQGEELQQTCCPASLADLVWSVAKLQYNPGKAWLNTFAATSLPLLSTFTPNQLAQVIWAFARLPYQPGQPWVDSFLCAVRDRLGEFDSKSVSLTAWGLATMKAQPTARWLFAFERQAERTLSTLAASELACTLWALSELKEKRADKLRLGRLVRRQEGEQMVSRALVAACACVLQANQCACVLHARRCLAMLLQHFPLAPTYGLIFATAVLLLLLHVQCFGALTMRPWRTHAC